MIQAHRAYNHPPESGQRPQCWSRELLLGEASISMPCTASPEWKVQPELPVPRRDQPMAAREV